jgi:hypothetical protein
LLKRILRESLSTRDVVLLVKENKRSEIKKGTIEGLSNVRLKKGQVIINSVGDELTKTLRILLREAEKGTIQKIIA